MFCKSCGSIGGTKRHMPGSVLIEFVLWCCFLIPGIIYTIWRHSESKQVCRTCASHEIIPKNSTIANRAQMTIDETVSEQSATPAETSHKYLYAGLGIILLLAIIKSGKKTDTVPEFSDQASATEQAAQSNKKPKTKAKAKVNKKNDLPIISTSQAISDAEQNYNQICGGKDLEECHEIAREEYQNGNQAMAEALAMQICIRGRTKTDACQWYIILNANHQKNYRKFVKPVFDLSCKNGNRQGCFQLELIDKWHPEAKASND
jgi:hypothetical protein